MSESRPRWLWLTALVTISGCITFDGARCEDGWICPAEQVCAPRGGGCVAAALVTACNNLTDGDPCSASGLGAGVCESGACVLVSCGDGVVSAGEQCDDGRENSDRMNASCRPGCLLPQCGDGVVDDLRGEVCDDGNRLDGDGCRPDCLSTETCGNDVVDFAVGEQCDDGSGFVGDGCSATCTIEVPIWTERLQWAGGGRRLTLDPARRRVVRYDGTTMEWDGVAWRTLRPRTSPGARTGFAMAYDSKRHRVLLFGGYLGQVERNDLWEWDGFDWRELPNAATTSPAPRIDASIAFDPHTGSMILFGGTSNWLAGPGATTHGDTWQWDGARWHQLTPSASPTARAGAAIATDPIRGEIVLFGGVTYSNAFQDTWIWDGASWVLRPQSGPVPPAARTDLAFDVELGRLVRQPTGGSAARVWSWDGAAWIDDGQTPAGLPFGWTTDPMTGTALMFAGANVFRRGDAGWSAVPQPSSPPARTDAGFAPWTRLGRTVLFGGTADGEGMVPLGDTWEWDGIQWRETTATSGTPPASGAAVMAEDPIDGVIVADGGSTWRYDATGWHALGATTPSGFVDITMAFDRDRRVTVLFGATFGGASQTWEWNGLEWSDVTPAGVSPPPRHATAMAYDERLHRVLVFGGYLLGSGLPELGDTWAWDGVAWTQLASNPLQRGQASLAFDRERGRTVLFGGYPSYGDTWEFDGTTWLPLSFDVLVSPRVAQMATDPRGGLVLFGGAYLNVVNNSFTTNSDTWHFGYGADSNSCATGIDVHGGGQGCADPACWHDCTPTCAPTTTCGSTEPRCGDGVCAVLETCRSCPVDCAPCTPRCGDGICDTGEIGCPGDCAF